MHYHIILTKKCNLNCSYCGGGSDTPPKEIRYSIPQLTSFISKDETPVIEFYGGEPLLRIDLMEQIMDSVQGRFVIQTNGILLDKIKPEYLSKFHSILVSIDGRKNITDGRRGAGIYDRILQNIRLIRQRGFRADLIARMTISQGTDIYENVTHLLELKDPGFDHVHWQLDFEMFWESWEHTIPGIEEWIHLYNSGISSLVKHWVEEMSRTGRVQGIVPFTGLMDSLLKGNPSGLRCGSGIDFFTIMPDGRISACPVSIDFDFSIVGSIFVDNPMSLCNRAGLFEPCLSCDIFKVCGGRCLFVNNSQHILRENGMSLICATVKHLIRELKDALPIVMALIRNGNIKQSDFEYPEFNNGCEIIP